MPIDLVEAVRGGAKASRRVRIPRKSRNALVEFVPRHIRTDTGAHGWAGYRPLKDICVDLTDDVPITDILKPVQLGFTTAIGFGFPFWQGYEQGRSGMYYLPTDKMVGDVMKSRLPEAIKGSDIESEIRNTASDGLILVGEDNRRIVWAGMESVRNVRQWPSDYNVYDEVDDLDADNLLVAKGRLTNSAYGHEIAFACGHYPGEGIHGRYLLGDQRRWVVTCAACRKEQIIEDGFPECMIRRDEVWAVVCIGCRRPINPEISGKFVAQRMSVSGRRSYQVSALAFGATMLDRLMADWAEAQLDRKKLALFRCERLALPDAGDRQAITAEILSRAVRPHAGGEAVPCYFLGIDVGDICHLAITGPGDRDGAVEFAWFGSCAGDRLVERVAALANEYPLGGVLIDQRPEGSLARAICRMFPGRAWLQSFRRTDEKSDEKSLDGETFDRLVMDRDELLEHFCDGVKNQKIWFPETWVGDRFVESRPGRHILTGSQKEEKRDANGLTVLRFRAGAVENHWFMASAFAWMIARRMSGQAIRVEEIRVGRERVTAGLTNIRQNRAKIEGLFT